MAGAGSGRANQRRRTRKDLLRAAWGLMQQGRKPTLDEVAAEAMVSRATVYRYFPRVEPLLVEAALDVAVPEPEALFVDGAPQDPVDRLELVDAAFEEMMAANEAPLRLMLAQSLQRGLENGAGTPARQNRRTPLIEAALEVPGEPGRFRPAERDRLAKALALVIGTEAMVVFRDVLQVDEADARGVRRWAIRALVEAARRPEGASGAVPRGGAPKM